MSIQILVVDDDIMNCTIMVRILKNLGYQATSAESGEQALKLLANMPFDMVLMDCQMPECDGYTTTSMLRVTNQTVPVIALTADSVKGTRERCLESGMNDYLVKPVSIDLLKTSINKYFPEQSMPE